MFDMSSELTMLHISAGDVRWPLPRLRDRDPEIIGEHVHGARRAVDLGFSGLGAELFVPVLAVQAGEVVAATCGASGYTITLDHDGWSTHYAHMVKMFVAPQLSHHRWQRQGVSAGEIIGYASRLRFEVWQRGALGDVAVDPRLQLQSWPVSADAGAF